MVFLEPRSGRNQWSGRGVNVKRRVRRERSALSALPARRLEGRRRKRGGGGGEQKKGKQTWNQKVELSEKKLPLSFSSSASPSFFSSSDSLSLSTATAATTSDGDDSEKRKHKKKRSSSPRPLSLSPSLRSLAGATSGGGARLRHASGGRRGHGQRRRRARRSREGERAGSRRRGASPPVQPGEGDRGRGRRRKEKESRKKENSLVRAARQAPRQGTRRKAPASELALLLLSLLGAAEARGATPRPGRCETARRPWPRPGCQGKPAGPSLRARPRRQQRKRLRCRCRRCRRLPGDRLAPAPSHQLPRDRRAAPGSRRRRRSPATTAAAAAAAADGGGGGFCSERGERSALPPPIAGEASEGDRGERCKPVRQRHGVTVNCRRAFAFVDVIALRERQGAQ